MSTADDFAFVRWNTTIPWQTKASLELRQSSIEALFRCSWKKCCDTSEIAIFTFLYLWWFVSLSISCSKSLVWWTVGRLLPCGATSAFWIQGLEVSWDLLRHFPHFLPGFYGVFDSTGRVVVSILQSLGIIWNPGNHIMIFDTWKIGVGRCVSFWDWLPDRC